MKHNCCAEKNLRGHRNCVVVIAIEEDSVKSNHVVRKKKRRDKIAELEDCYSLRGFQKTIFSHFFMSTYSEIVVVIVAIQFI